MRNGICIVRPEDEFEGLIVYPVSDGIFDIAEGKKENEEYVMYVHHGYIAELSKERATLEELKKAVYDIIRKYYTDIFDLSHLPPIALTLETAKWYGWN